MGAGFHMTSVTRLALGAGCWLGPPFPTMRGSHTTAWASSQHGAWVLKRGDIREGTGSQILQGLVDLQRDFGLYFRGKMGNFARF